MKRALVLNAGASWCAYQVGALRHLLEARRWHFDLLAGTGIGAMNCAFVACGQFAALESFWSGLRLTDLLPSRRRRFMAAHLREAALAERGTTLLVTALNLQTGRLEVLRYPGSDLPLIDGLLAAGALPGATPPVPYRGASQLVEGTLVDAVPMRPALDEHPDDLVAILPMLPARPEPASPWDTWRTVLRRALEVNQAEDGRRAVTDAERAGAEVEAYRRAAEGLIEAAAGMADGALSDRLRRRLDGRQPRQAPRTLVIRPSRYLGYPMWRFRRDDLRAAATLGEHDARTAT